MLKELKVNETPVRTSRNFNINNAKLKGINIPETIGNFENVGYCKDNLECFYNIQIMEEKQTIISFGAGATSKFYFEDTNLIKRAFNVKSVDDYINRIDEMIQRKREIIEEESK